MVIGKRISVHNLLYGILCAIFFVLLDRTLQIIYVSGSGGFAWVSKIAMLLVVVGARKHYKRVLSKKMNGGSLVVTVVYLVYAAFTTIINSNSLYTAIASAYPILGMSLYLALAFLSIHSCKVLINAISDVYIILVTINLICILLSPELFGERYFLGIENQIGYTLVIGELFVYLDSELRHVKRKKNYYHFLCTITLLLIFSASNLIGLFVVVVYFVIRPFQNFVKHHSIRWFFAVYCVIWVLMIMVDPNIILNIPVVRFVIENVLGKNVTLSTRTYIWQVAAPLFLQKPWLGHGIGETTNVFHVYKEFTYRATIDKYYSAHNQMLQSLYEVGVIGVGIVVLLGVLSDKTLNKCKNESIIGVFRISVIATLIMMFAEAPGLYPLFFILNLAALVPRLFND